MPSKKAKPAAATPAALPAGRSGRAFSKMLDAKSAQSLLSQLEQAKKEKQKKKKWYERKIAPEDRVDFSSPLCRCKDDPGVCCIGTWCACIVIPQLYEREIGPPGSCKKWFFRLGVLCSINVVVLPSSWVNFIIFLVSILIFGPKNSNFLSIFTKKISKVARPSRLKRAMFY